MRPPTPDSQDIYLARPTTGRYVLHFDPERATEATRLLEDAGLKVASSSDSDSRALRGDEVKDADVLVLPHIGVALAAGDDECMSRIEAMGQLGQPESVFQAIQPESVFSLGPDDEPPEVGEHEAALGIDAGPAWHLGACRVSSSTRTGAGVRVAVLDTGLVLNHRDFQGRIDVGRTASFVFNVPTAEDGHGHGTHTAGLVCGPAQPALGPRYGVAPEAQLFVGKVISDAGIGATGEVLSGVDWAIAHGCSVVLMALEVPVALGARYDEVWEQKGILALRRDCLLVAAVGNGSNRPHPPAPVSEPANCPSIFGVGAAAPPSGLYKKSNGERGFPGAGTVDLLAPGVRIHSSDRLPRAYRFRDGTSMAAAVTAGVAALWAEADPSLRGARLGTALRASAFPLGIPREDGGSGLVQAPQ